MSNTAGKILVIDNNQKSIDSIKEMLNIVLPNTAVFTSLTGEHGLMLAAAEIPDMIFVDIHLSGMDGLEVCTRLKTDKTLCDIPVVFITVPSDEEFRIKALDCGAEGFLLKPINASELTAQIRAMLKISAANGIATPNVGHMALAFHQQRDAKKCATQAVSSCGFQQARSSKAPLWTAA